MEKSRRPLGQELCPMVHHPLLGREAESFGLLPQTVRRAILTFHGLENNHSKYSANRIFNSIRIRNVIYDTLPAFHRQLSLKYKMSLMLFDNQPFQSLFEVTIGAIIQ